MVGAELLSFFFPSPLFRSPNLFPCSNLCLKQHSSTGELGAFLHHGGHGAHTYVSIIALHTSSHTFLITEFLLKRERGYHGMDTRMGTGTLGCYFFSHGDFYGIWDMFTWCMDFRGCTSDVMSSEALCVGCLMLLGEGGKGEAREGRNDREEKMWRE